jgi:hypothetical protein
LKIDFLGLPPRPLTFFPKSDLFVLKPMNSADVSYMGCEHSAWHQAQIFFIKDI